MGAYELFEMRKMSKFSGTMAIDADQRRKVGRSVSVRTVTSMLLASTAAVLGDGAAPARRTSLAGIINGFTQWHAA